MEGKEAGHLAEQPLLGSDVVYWSLPEVESRVHNG